MVAYPRRTTEDSGFTLLELLVVIIIIGILAAIAIPVFLHQRQKGYDAQARSDLRNLADFEEIYLSDRTRYGTIAEIESSEPHIAMSKGVTLSVVVYNAAQGYCLSAQHSASPNLWFYDSQAGGLQPPGSTGCPVTTSGTPGDSITG
jgi:type IV pilus assembly protein PilA